MVAQGKSPLLFPSTHAHGSCLGSQRVWFAARSKWIHPSRRWEGRKRQDSTQLVPLSVEPYIKTLLASLRTLLSTLLCPLFTSPFVAALCCACFGCGILFHSKSICIPCLSDFFLDFWCTTGTSWFLEQITLSKNLEWRERLPCEICQPSWVRSEVILPGLYSFWYFWNIRCFSWAIEKRGRLEGLLN